MPDKSAVVLICAVAFGFIAFVITCVAYATGAYYQIIDKTKNETAEYECKILRKAQDRSGKPPEDKRASCPSADIVLASLICAAISLFLTIFTLLVHHSDQFNKQSQRVKILLTVVASTVMNVAGFLLIGFLIWFSFSNFPCTTDKEAQKYKQFGRSVDDRSVPIPTKEEKKTCGSLMNYVYKHYLLIAATPFAVLSGALSVISIIFLIKGSGGQQVQPEYKGGPMKTPSQWSRNMMTPSQWRRQMMPPNQNGEGQIVTPSQVESPQAQPQ